MKPSKLFNKKVLKLASNFGFTIRIGETPEEVDIITAGMKNKPPKHTIGAYFGEGVIFIYLSKAKKHSKDDLNLVLLHEMGHGILDFYKLDLPKRIEENMCNAIAIAFASMLRLTISCYVQKCFKKCAQGRKK